METVYVTLWSHRHGEDIAVFTTKEKAEHERQLIAQNNWDDEMSKPMPEAASQSDIADMYFAYMAERGEFFEVLTRLVDANDV